MVLPVLNAKTFEIIATLVASIATAVNTVFVIILVRLTGKYTRITGEILKAAQAQASASQAQASAASASIGLLREQIESQLGLGRTIVQSAISSALAQIEYWKSVEVSFSTSRTLPPTDDLLPANAMAAVEHARRLSSEGAERLSAAFDCLKLARNEIEGVRQWGQLYPNMMATFKAVGDGQKAAKYLTSAFAELQSAQQHFL